jgi:hypothetical protein
MDELDQLRVELADALTTQRHLKAETQNLSLELLDLRADCDLLRTVVAALWGQASPVVRGQIEVLLSDPAKVILSSPLAGDGAQRFRDRGRAFREYLDRVAI